MPGGSPARPLEGRGIVITRPAGQAQALVRLIRERGGRPILFPVIEILDVADRASLDALIDRLEAFDLAIFVSPNAVEKAMAAIGARRSLPPRLTVVAIGRGSASALRRQGVPSAIAPHERSDSEALLELPELQAVAGKRIVIFRGEGGRALLGDTLMARGASVEYAECYRRTQPSADVAPLIEGWARGEVDAIVATSSEGLRNLHDMLGDAGREPLASTPLFVPHPRIAATAGELGLTTVIVTQPGDEGVAESIARHFAAAS